MKTIRPSKQEEKTIKNNEKMQLDLILKPQIISQEIVNDNLDVLMQETINENKIKVQITLTKRQYELWLKKGAEKWLKRVLVGQQNKKRK